MESTCLKKKVTSNKHLVSTTNKSLVLTQKCSNEILALTAQSYEEYPPMTTICFEKSVAVKAENVTNIFLCCFTIATNFVQQKYLPSSAFFPFPSECKGDPGKPGLQKNTTIKRKNGPESCYVPCNPARATCNWNYLNPRNSRKFSIQKKIDFSDSCNQNYMIFFYQSEAIIVHTEMYIKPPWTFPDKSKQTLICTNKLQCTMNICITKQSSIISSKPCHRIFENTLNKCAGVHLMRV